MSVPLDEKASAAGSEFPYLGLAVGILILHALLTVSWPASPLRSAVAVVSAFAMGYCLLAILVAGRVRMSSAEILAFTVGLGVAVTSLSALAVSALGVPITDYSVLAVGLPIGLLALLTRHRVGSASQALLSFLRRGLDFSDYSRTEKIVAAALFLSILGSLVAVLSLSGVPYADRPTMGIGITGGDGRVDSLPATISRGQTVTLQVHVLANATPAWPAAGAGTFILRIRLVPVNATGAELFHSVHSPPLRLDPFGEHNESITIAPQGSWMESLPIVVDASGSVILRFELLQPSGAVVAETHLPLLVT